MTYKYLRAVQENGPDYFLIYEGVKVFGASPIARCDKEEEAKRIVGALNEVGHKREEQNDVDYIGCRIAARLTDSLNSKVPVPYRDLQQWVYDEIEQIEKEHRLGDWIELPNGTTYTLTFKPQREL